MRWSFGIALVVVALLASAATVGAERLLTGADIRDGSITGRDIRRGSLEVEHLERKARHAVFRTSTRQTRQVAQIAAVNSANVASLALPAGEYAIHASASLGSLGGASAYCGITDSAKVLTALPTQSLTASSSTTTVVPLTTFATATYGSPVTVYLTCKVWANEVSFYNPMIIAEQVDLR